MKNSASSKYTTRDVKYSLPDEWVERGALGIHGADNGGFFTEKRAGLTRFLERNFNLIFFFFTRQIIGVTLHDVRYPIPQVLTLIIHTKHCNHSNDTLNVIIIIIITRARKHDKFP